MTSILGEARVADTGWGGGGWRQLAACRDIDDPDMFFPDERGRQSGAEAKAICASCPVSGDCLADALRAGDRHGVWGRTSGRERRRMLSRTGKT